MSQDQQEKTFKVRCIHCQKPFHVRFPLARSDVEESKRVSVSCQYCGKDVMIKIPGKYVQEDHLLRGIRGEFPSNK